MTTPPAAADPVTRGLAQLLAQKMAGLELVDGALIHITATAGPDGEYIDVTVTRKPFLAEDTSRRHQLWLTQPLTTTYADDVEVTTNGVGTMDVAAGEPT